MDKYSKMNRYCESYRDQLPIPEIPVRQVAVRESLSFIHDHLYNYRLSVTWMKEELKISGNGLASIFKYYVGRTPKNYWLYHRIEVSKQLLRHKEFRKVDVGRIGMEVGFSSPAHFSQTFKRWVGSAPTEWRNGRMGKVNKNVK